MDFKFSSHFAYMAILTTVEATGVENFSFLVSERRNFVEICRLVIRSQSFKLTSIFNAIKMDIQCVQTQV